MLNGSGWPRFGKAVMQDTSGWFRPPVGPGLSSYYVPKSFLDLVKAWSPGWAPRELPPAVYVPWVLPNQSDAVAREERTPPPPDPERWTIHINPSAPSYTPSTTDTTPPPEQEQTYQELQENPSATRIPVSLLPSSSASSRSVMAFQRSDPRPFIPENLQWLEVENRVPVARAVVAARPPLQNEDLAIVSFDHLPGNPIDFAAVDEILREFFHERRIHFTEIQPSTLGQALVRFAHRIDRDNLVSLGPIPFQDVHISFTEHNKGRNWRRAYFNTEVWLMLMEFPADYWEHGHIQNALSSFGKLLHWRNDRSRLVRLILKARVLDLQSVPQFIVLSDTVGLESDSWTVQCEILQSRLLGAGPQDEDPMPVNPIPVGAPFDFFGLGQPGNGPAQIQDVQQDENQEQEQEDQNQQLDGPVDIGAWDLEPQPQPQQPQAPNNALNLNLAQPVEEEVAFDLNQPGDIEDPMEVIVNPVNQLAHEEFLELNDLLNNIEDEEINIQQVPEQVQGNQHQILQVDPNFLAQEENLMQLADEEMQHFQIPLVDVLPEEINQEDLMNDDELMAEHEALLLDNLAQDNLVGPEHLGLPALGQELAQDLNANPSVDPIAVMGLNEPQQVMEGNVQQNIIDEEHMVVDEAQLNLNEVGENQHLQAHNLNVGMALTFGPQADPVWIERSRMADATRLWANFFATGNRECIQVSIPSNWANFFTVMLLSPDLFTWAKEFLSSKAVSCLGREAGVIDFNIPKNCPKIKSCDAVPDASPVPKVTTPEETLSVAVLGQKATPRKRVSKRACPVVDTELRRSSRGKQVSGGFRKDTCSDRRCLFCLPNPPTLNNQVIRKLGKEMAQLEEEQLTDVVLDAKKEQKKIGQEKTKNKGDGPAEKEKKNNEDSTN